MTVFIIYHLHQHSVLKHLWTFQCLITWPFNSKDLIVNSPFWLLHIPKEINCEKFGVRSRWKVVELEPLSILVVGCFSTCFIYTIHPPLHLLIKTLKFSFRRVTIHIYMWLELSSRPLHVWKQLWASQQQRHFSSSW